MRSRVMESLAKQFIKSFLLDMYIETYEIPCYQVLSCKIERNLQNYDTFETIGSGAWWH